MNEPILYSYWRSSCSWRIRIALAWKGIKYEIKPIHLIKDGGQQVKDDYVQINPMKQVPSLQAGDVTLIQSLSIMEYLEETYPSPPLLPKDALDRSTVRSIAEIIACDIQPIQNLRVLKKVGELAGDESKMDWARHWIDNGFSAVEKIVQECGGKYCFGDAVTFADVCLVPQVYNANRFKIDMSKYPTIDRIHENLIELDAFKVSHPSRQVDCPEEFKVQ
ncbi:GSTZ1 (predicted) [Pycnogonum litorale]